jgi:hypothetical protein
MKKVFLCYISTEAIHKSFSYEINASFRVQKIVHVHDITIVTVRPMRNFVVQYNNVVAYLFTLLQKANLQNHITNVS